MSNLSFNRVRDVQISFSALMLSVRLDQSGFLRIWPFQIQYSCRILNFLTGKREKTGSKHGALRALIHFARYRYLIVYQK